MHIDGLMDACRDEWSDTVLGAVMCDSCSSSDECVDDFLDHYGEHEPYDFRIICGAAVAYVKEG